MSKGGGSDSGTQTVTTVNKADPWSGVQPYLKQLYAGAGKLYGGEGQQYFPWQTYALQSPLSEVGQRAVLGYANNYLPGLAETGTQGIASLMNSADVANNPYVNNMIGAQADNITRQLTQQWLPQVRSGASAAGQYGSTRQGLAEGSAIGEAARALANSAAQTQLGAYSEGLGAQKAALALLPQQAQLGMLPAQLYQQVGAQQEGYNTQAINDAIARFNFAQSEPYNRNTWFNSILTGAAPYASSTSSGVTKTDTGGSSTLGNVLGGGMTGYSLGNALGSSAMGTAVSTGLNLPAYMPLGIPGMILGAALGGLFG